jgi:hypothetical protein
VMARRTFLAMVSGGLLAAPLAAEAQHAAKIARIGYLSPNLATSPHLREAFRQGLRDLGYVEGRNDNVIPRFTQSGWGSRQGPFTRSNRRGGHPGHLRRRRATSPRAGAHRRSGPSNGVTGFSIDKYTWLALA